MKINLAKSAGFCFGVKRALNIALDTASSCNNVYMLGDIVHNEDVVKQVHIAGIKKIKKLIRGKDKILLVRAHGVAEDTYQKARRLGYRIIDATCPMVKEIHRIAKDMELKGYTVIVIGDREHDEVRGISGQLKNRAIIIDDIKNIPLSMIKGLKKACVVVQSTQNIEKVEKISALLKKYIKNLKFYNTICKPTRIKQGEIKQLPLKNDVMIIIGSRNSANTKRLFEISRSLNKRSYWVSSEKELKKGWFKAAKSAGITAGASTPGLTTKAIIEKIRSFR